MSTDTLNGKPRRKQLSDQLDRFDGIIDALAGGLPEAVAAATRDGAREAIAEVLRELLADPARLAVLRGGGPAPTPTEPKPSAWTRLKAAVRAAATGVITAAKELAARVEDRMRPVAAAVRARVRRVRSTVVATRRLLDLAWRVRRAVGVGLAVGLTVLLACQLSHTAASVLAALSTGLTASAAHLGLWARSTVRRVLQATS